MKQSIIYLTIIFMSISTSFAQMKKIENAESFVKKMGQNSSSVKSIESDFKQIKHIEAFNQDFVSSGKFYYRVNDKICLNYVVPKPYRIVINSNKIKVESDGKKNVMNLKDNKQMQEMQNMLSVCMTGNLSNISKDYRMEFYEDEQSYLITVKPVNEGTNKYMLDVYLNKKDMSVDKLRISESESDYTEYIFSNKKINTLNNDTFFKI